MPKAAKKKTLTLEKKFEKALVSKEKWPYEVSENWVWTRLGDICVDIQYGYTAKAINDNRYPKMLRITDIQEIGVIWETVPNCIISVEDFEKYKIIPYDIFFARTGATTGKSFMVTTSPKSVYASYLIRMRISPLFEIKCIYYFLQSDLYWKQITELSSGIAQPGVNSTKLQTIVFPLPPLAEQQRIVDRIESLFAKLDEAKEKAQTALNSFETRKAAILHKAFTGELTAKWREENGVSLESWEESLLGKYVNTKYGYTESACEERVGPKFLRITDIQNNSVEWKVVPYCKIDEKNYPRYLLNIGDIVIARTGATTGKSYLIQDNVDAVYASYLIKVSILNSSRLSEYFIYYFMQSTFYWDQITEFSQGIAQPGVNANKIKQLKILLPPISEQTEIVRLLDNFFAKEQRAKELCSILDKIDLIKKSILARAFRGKLGTNDPNDENAVELLKQCLQQDKA